MHARVKVVVVIPVLLVSVACGGGVDGPQVPSADAVKSIVVMTKVADVHPRVNYVENRESIVELVDFVERELVDWYVSEADEAASPVTTAAFEGHGGQMLYYLFLGDEWVGAAGEGPETQPSRMARLEPAQLERLRSLLGAGDA